MTTIGGILSALAALTLAIAAVRRARPSCDRARWLGLTDAELRTLTDEQIDARVAAHAAGSGAETSVGAQQTPALTSRPTLRTYEAAS